MRFIISYFDFMPSNCKDIVLHGSVQIDILVGICGEVVYHMTV